MAKKKGGAVEYVWLQCSETGDLNYRTPMNVREGTVTLGDAGGLDMDLDPDRIDAETDRLL